MEQPREGKREEPNALRFWWTKIIFAGMRGTPRPGCNAIVPQGIVISENVLANFDPIHNAVDYMTHLNWEMEKWAGVLLVERG